MSWPLRRRSEDSSLDAEICCHTFRATGITAYLYKRMLENDLADGGTHESPRTTKLYDRTSDEITLEEVERIAI
jgi:integrase/recombinase XerD